MKTDTLIVQQKKVKIPINSYILIAEIQTSFQEYFPFLNINFYKSSPSSTSYNSVKKYCHPGKRLSSELILKKEGALDISPDMTIKQLLENMEREFGLSVQIFRKSANFWMEITLTLEWTLEQQNNHGREISIQ